MLLPVTAVVAGSYFRADKAARFMADFVAHNVCIRTFVSGIDPDASFAAISDVPSVRPWRYVMSYQVDRTAKVVETSVMGVVHGQATFRQGFGCTLRLGSKPPYLLRNDLDALSTPTSPALLPDIAPPTVVEPSNAALVSALDHAFEEPAGEVSRRTKAVVVVHNGRVIAERYAPGVGVDTQLLGFSLSKSVVNALIGILQRKNLIQPSMAAPIAQWQGANDLRRAITVEHLMRMTSGLALDETFLGFDEASRMYLDEDMTGYAAKAPLIAPPGTRWHYSSGSAQLLAGIIRDIVGGPEQTLAFAWRELLNPLGMRHVTLEFDASGTLQGASNMLASARDWARFGMLYLNNGQIGNVRLFNENWVDFSATATLDTDYGAGFWTNRSTAKGAANRIRAGIPRDAFFAAGFLDQRIAIIPSRNLVIVRLGDSTGRSGGGVERLIAEVLSAIKH
ncbi:beta-lactamase family protein [Bradyrhizobium sp. ISRA443]|uniref:serine hydrolase domain-containing protein n=1 Tax=unclassified Bradyrhizobium TaxID=2631580 RepID=UPI0024785830|nr:MULTISPECIES: serine hydrolase [unclassified Bradyrhizobium]WGR94714.1 beta-lactamase family protein [Bradyrhizobium sp. ISRA435]WGR99532.1 beta-lactamase family protein [Bradyrhizobium sp. ISRA436]WGS06422.1 beta-lactamase family protein [Bradyrhizobium sp. ISRA437]WGS13306.1 beta-lactamase family protein [Bradyrhizobium sp. ISRA443]